MRKFLKLFMVFAFLGTLVFLSGCFGSDDDGIYYNISAADELWKDFAVTVYKFNIVSEQWEKVLDEKDFHLNENEVYKAVNIVTTKPKNGDLYKFVVDKLDSNGNKTGEEMALLMKKGDSKLDVSKLTVNPFTNMMVKKFDADLAANKARAIDLEKLNKILEKAKGYVATLLKEVSSDLVTKTDADDIVNELLTMDPTKVQDKLETFLKDAFGTTVYNQVKESQKAKIKMVEALASEEIKDVTDLQTVVDTALKEAGMSETIRNQIKSQLTINNMKKLMQGITTALVTQEQEAGELVLKAIFDDLTSAFKLSDTISSILKLTAGSVNKFFATTESVVGTNYAKNYIAWFGKSISVPVELSYDANNNLVYTNNVNESLNPYAIKINLPFDSSSFFTDMVLSLEMKVKVSELNDKSFADIIASLDTDKLSFKSDATGLQTKDVYLKITGLKIKKISDTYYELDTSSAEVYASNDTTYPTEGKSVSGISLTGKVLTIDVNDLLKAADTDSIVTRPSYDTANSKWVDFDTDFGNTNSTPGIGNNDWAIISYALRAISATTVDGKTIDELTVDGKNFISSTDWPIQFNLYFKDNDNYAPVVKSTVKASDGTIALNMNESLGVTLDSNTGTWALTTGANDSDYKYASSDATNATAGGDYTLFNVKPIVPLALPTTSKVEFTADLVLKVETDLNPGTSAGNATITWSNSDAVYTTGFITIKGIKFTYDPSATTKWTIDASAVKVDVTDGTNQIYTDKSIDLTGAITVDANGDLQIDLPSLHTKLDTADGNTNGTYTGGNTLVLFKDVTSAAMADLTANVGNLYDSTDSTTGQGGIRLTINFANVKDSDTNEPLKVYALDESGHYKTDLTAKHIIYELVVTDSAD